MTEVNRVALMGKFQNGDRPDESDFGNLIESCLNKVSDGLKVDGDLNFVLSRGLQLGDSASTAAGTLRFNSGAVQFNNGTTWLPIGGNAGAFASLTPTTVAYGGGLVGIGSTFTTASPPTYRLEVNLAANTATTEQVRFGSAVIANGVGAFTSAAVFSHRNHATDTNYALRQLTGGAVHINCATNQVISLRQNNVPMLSIAPGGQVIIGGGGDASDPSAPANEILQVHGQACKNAPGGTWSNFSDARLKEDVHDLQEGLSQLRRVRPVRFRYNHLMGASAGARGVGIVAQEIEQVFPETISRCPDSAQAAGGGEGLRVFDASMLTFVLINAVKELAEKVETLEAALATRDGTPA